MTAPDGGVYGRLGCAERYDVLIHAQGGRGLFANVGGIAELTWGRVLDDYSEAEVVVSKSDAGAECCRRLGQVRPWAHELSIYRDGGLVWQGPIWEIVESTTQLTFSARDLLFWLDRREILPLSPIRNGQRVTDDQGNDHYECVTVPAGPGVPAWRHCEPPYYEWTVPTNFGEVARFIMRDAFPPGDDSRDPGLMDYARIDVGTAVQPRDVTLDRVYRGEKTVGEVLRDLLDVGADMFTIGRRVYIVPDDYRLAQADRAPYRFTADDFLEELEVRHSGADAATVVYAVGDSPIDPNTGQPVQAPSSAPEGWQVPPVIRYYGKPEPGYGKVTRITESDNTSSPTALYRMAWSTRDYSYPPPVDIVVPDGAQLAPHAPVSINQLVPGRPVLVMLDDFCRPVSQQFRMSEIEVEWTSDEIESVKVTLSSNGPAEEEESNP